ncbi:transposon-encoded TnpW family protein [Qiania dongpingensis]|uniref:Transposon-encoded TnpW family protein n=1 Tax=Qiania dongpingensis TaxID=2763669 RepID=A0A7G9G0V3_9FIRM|nr:transposon-encoded TnpW family protein [Qiania dongpingensis]QNM04435.1 transposon-encoded TnpW family protein [Qiania dongpingensis]
MSNEQTNITTATESAAPITAPEAEPFALVKKIGKTTYKVRIHFSTTSHETMSDKIKRMLKNEIQQM